MELVGLINNSLWVVWYTAPLWLPIISAMMAWQLWIQYARKRFYTSNKKILLEVRLPQDITKSPIAMELVLTALYITSREGTFVDRLIKGQKRPYFSLELVSLGGSIRFFIWTEANYKNLIEAQIYAQYPGVEIIESPDYTSLVTFDPAKNQIWACEFIKTGPNPLPIKTYVDYGMDKDPDEEYKIDPITPTIEFLGSIKESDQIWLQIIIQAHKKEKRIPDKKKGGFKLVDWKEDAGAEKKKILDGLKDKDNPTAPARRLTRSEEDIIAAIDRTTAKLPFNVGIRALYTAPKESFNKLFVSGITGMLRQYNAENLNGFKPDKSTSFDYPWQDFRNYRLNKKRKSMLKYYKNRAFWGLQGRKPFVMSTEELATMYHFPGRVSATPSFARIMSKKSEPPANLPL